MSDYYPQEPHNYLDIRTFHIINGYIRQSQRSLSSTLLNLIPSEITCITSSYVDDHFMLYRGSHQFTVHKRHMISLRNGSSIARSFEIGNLRWIIDIYPNGNHHSDNGKFQVLLTCISIPAEWESIIVRRTLTCPQIVSANVSLVTKYTKPKNAYYWSTDEMFLNEMKSNATDKLSFIISIKILQIIKKVPNKLTGVSEERIWFRSPVNKYKKYYKLQWKVSEAILQQRSQWSTHKILDSKIVDDMFCIGIGFRENGDQLSVYLALSSLPVKSDGNNAIIHALYVQCTVHIPELNVQRCGVKTLNLKKWKFGFDEPIKEKINTCKSLTLVMEVEILKELDEKGNVLDDITEQPWLKIVPKNNEKVKKTNVSYTAKTSEEITPISLIDRLTKAKSDSELETKQEESKNMNENKTTENYTQFEMNEQNETKQYDMKLLPKLLHEIQQMTLLNNGMYSGDCESEMILIEEFESWLKGKPKLYQYYDVLKQNGFDNMDAVKTLTDDDLQLIGMDKKGHRKQLLMHIRKLIDNNEHSVAVLNTKIELLSKEIQAVKQNNYLRYTRFDVIAIMIVLIVGILFGKLCL